MNPRHFFLVFLLGLLSLPLAATAATVNAKLISDKTAIVSGETSQIGVLFSIPPGWHIYGRAAVDTGLPTVIKLNLPDGFIAGDIAWPREEAFNFQGITGQGYSGKILLPAKLHAPKNLKSGATIPIAAHVEWLVCKDICIPEQADLLLSLPVASIAQDSEQAVLFSDSSSAPKTTTAEFLRSIMLALLGGLLLNLMPCVFPILSMKAMGLVKKSGYEKRAEIVQSGLFYAAGVIASFWVLAAVLILLKAVGASVGWGVQLQSPAFVLLLSVVLLTLGLMFSDFIRIKDSFVNIGNSLTRAPSHWGTFFTGALAVIVAAPCTAPFMGGAMFYAFTQHWPITLAVFTALGIGLAAPYLCITLYPPALKLLPPPGAWMVKLKKILALPLYAAAIWLLWVFVQQVGIVSTAVNHKNAQPYSASRLAELRAAHQPVFVNMTAAWCITCIFNEKNALSRDEVQSQFKADHITYLVGDWTNRDAEITKFLANYYRVGVPLYVYFPVRGEPKILPQILTPEIVMKEISPPLPEGKSRRH